MPARPQPTPNSRLPRINRRSRRRFAGRWSGPPNREVGRRRATANESGKGSDNGAGHHQRQRRIPRAGQIEKCQNLSGVGHAGQQQTETEQHAAPEASQQRHRSGAQHVADGEHGQEPGRHETEDRGQGSR